MTATRGLKACRRLLTRAASTYRNACCIVRTKTPAVAVHERVEDATMRTHEATLCFRSSCLQYSPVSWWELYTIAPRPRRTRAKPSPPASCQPKQNSTSSSCDNSKQQKSYPPPPTSTPPRAPHSCRDDTQTAQLRQGSSSYGHGYGAATAEEDGLGSVQRSAGGRASPPLVKPKVVEEQKSPASDGSTLVSFV